MARCVEVSALLGVEIHKQVLIFDLTGLPLFGGAPALGLKLFRRVVAIDCDYYPETLDQQFIINAPPAFAALWRLVSSWLDPTTRRKFRILGSNYRSALIEAIHPSVLPVEYGGTCPVKLAPLRLRREDAEEFMRRYGQHQSPSAHVGPVAAPRSGEGEGEGKAAGGRFSHGHKTLRERLLRCCAFGPS